MDSRLLSTRRHSLPRGSADAEPELEDGRNEAPSRTRQPCNYSVENVVRRKHDCIPLVVAVCKVAEEHQQDISAQTHTDTTSPIAYRSA